MIVAYKAFKEDLSCTSGGNHFQYVLNAWNEEPAANCYKNGFHCAEDPLDCLSYYPWEGSVFYIVLAAGDIHEDGSDSKISCTKMKLIKKLTLEQFVAESLIYLSNHPKRKSGNGRVRIEEGIASSPGFAIVRGKNPIAKGEKGDILAYAREYNNSSEIEEIGMLVVDGENIKENCWYSIEGKEVSV